MNNLKKEDMQLITRFTSVSGIEFEMYFHAAEENIVTATPMFDVCGILSAKDFSATSESGRVFLIPLSPYSWIGIDKETKERIVSDINKAII